MEVSEDAPLLIVHRLGGDGGHLVTDVGFEESTAADALFLDLAVSLAKRVLTLDPTHDKVRMLKRLRDEKTCGFGNGVAGLDDLLPRRNVGADEDVQVRRALVSHGCLRFEDG